MNSQLYELSFEEQAAASAISVMNQQQSQTCEKRGRDDSADAAGGAFIPPQKVSRTDSPVTARPPNGRELLPAPYFYYRNRSHEVDEDPLTPLTPPGRVPNFPAKMHAILSRPDFRDIVAWLPHGRSWRVLKPREFEIKVIPLFFEHAKFSSFVRQANGWGFRRLTQGKDRNSYYHEQFLRGLPHLCKTMKRPGVNQKKTADPEHEPDFYKISEEHPVPEKADDESIMLQCTVQGGPRARMPIYTGPTMATSGATATPMMLCAPSPTNMVEDSSKSSATPMPEAPKSVVQMPLQMPMPMFAAPATASAAHQQQQAAAPTPFVFAMPAMNMNMNSAAASQFAAGFAAATAFSQQHFNALLSNMQQQQQQTQPQQQQHHQ